MKRSVYGRRNAILSPGVSRAGIALIVIVIAVLAVRVVAPGFVATMLYPFSYLSRGALSGIAGVGSVVTSSAALEVSLSESKDYIVELEAQNRELTARVTDFEALLGTRIEAPPGVLAGVVARPPQSPYDTLIIDQGSDAGVGVGAIVAGRGGSPVGTVASVTTSSARILLHSAPGRVTEAWLGENRTPLTLTGDGAGAFSAEAPREASIAVGEEVFIAGPGSLPLGIVVRVDSDPSSPTVAIHVESYANPFTLTWVTVAPPVILP